MLCPVLVGRQAELDLLGGLLRPPGGGMAVVSGGAGIGKSRLVSEFADHAAGRGWVILRGRAVPGGQPVPYRPLAEALLAGCRRLGTPEDEDLVPYRSALGLLLPQWHRPELAMAGLSVVLGEGVLRVLRALGGEHGAVLVVEDVHWADAETLGVLEYVADHAAEEGLAVVLTTRDEPSAGLDMVRELIGRRAAVPINLTPLSRRNVAAMASRILKTDEAPPGLNDLLGRAEGVPFLVEELLAAAADAGTLVHDGGAWTVRAGVDAVLPQTLIDAMARRIGALPAQDRVVPQVAALLGRHVDLDLLASVLNRSHEEVAAALGRCVDLQVLAVDADGYAFRHALTRDAVQAGVRPDARVLWARRARTALDTAHPGLPGGWCAQAAEWSALAGDTDDAAVLLLTAGSRAADAGALTSAAALLDQAREWAGDRGRFALDINEQRVHVAALAGDVDSATAHAREVLTGPDTSRRARVHLRLAEAASEAAQWERAEQELAAARLLPGDDAQRARIEALTAQVLLGGAHVAEAEATAHRALAIAERLNLADVSCPALEVLGRIARNRDHATAEQWFARQRVAAAAAGLAGWELRSTHQLGTLDLLRANRTDRLARAGELAAETGAMATAATIDLQLGMSAWLMLDPAACVEQARRCQQPARRLRLDLLLAEALLLEAAGHGFAGRRAAMESAIAEAARLGRPEADLDASAWAHRGGYALLREDRNQALTAYDTAITILRSAPLVYLRPYWRYWALLKTVTNDGGDAARAETRQLGQLDNVLTQAILGYADAVAAGRSGHAGEAEALFADARAGAEPPGFAGQRHLAERLVAECALADGWGDPTAWLTEAAGFFQRAGHLHVERGCRSLLHSAGAGLPRRPHTPSRVPPALAQLGITDREADVLALVAEGLTSKQIAGRLYLSVRTVDKHVERLLAKTGVSRRAELRTFCT